MSENEHMKENGPIAVLLGGASFVKTHKSFLLLLEQTDCFHWTNGAALIAEGGFSLLAGTCLYLNHRGLLNGLH